MTLCMHQLSVYLCTCTCTIVCLFISYWSETETLAWLQSWGNVFCYSPKLSSMQVTHSFLVLTFLILSLSYSSIWHLKQNDISCTWLSIIFIWHCSMLFSREMAGSSDLRNNPFAALFESVDQAQQFSATAASLKPQTDASSPILGTHLCLMLSTLWFTHSPSTWIPLSFNRARECSIGWGNTF